ncbi:prolyl oligopeptidase family serine peptidase [Sphingomonas sp. YL-JM2C]
MSGPFRMKGLVAAGIAAGAIGASLVPAQPALAAARENVAMDDPFRWLEEVEGARALAQVGRWNAATRERLANDAHYRDYAAAAKAILAAQDKVIPPTFFGDHVYRLRTDVARPRGLWERASLESYRGGQPDWEPVLDLDALAAAEGKSWAWRGATCNPDRPDRCLLVLSDGGGDAWEIREFDVGKRAFVEDGIRLPATKGAPTHLEVTDLPVAWIDGDSVIATRIWAPDTATAAGYGFVVKKLRRGQPIGQAEEVYRGRPGDVSAAPLVFRDGRGRQVALVARRLGFFEVEYAVLTDHGPVALPLPKGVTARGLIDGQLLVTLREPWTFAGRTFPEGAVVAIDVDQAVADPARLRPVLVMAPGDRQAIDQVLVTRDRVLIGVYTNVQGQLLTAERDADGDWTTKPFRTPPMSAVRIVSTSSVDDGFAYLTESYLQPETLFVGDAATGEARQASAAPPQFDASGHVVEQLEAVAEDGTRIPYYLVHPRAMRKDGGNPTILCAYGGLQYVNAPSYFPVTGKLWLEQGGSLAIAHIRGGGEFGPKWHRAAQRARRQVAFDDFAAVARDMIARGLTSSRRLGIRGSSNGGLLAGVEFTQHPELWSAALLNVGLYDMLNYTHMLAGASWMSEFGDPADPVEGAFLKTISPYHNLKAGVTYPPPLIMTATNDDRVHPGHSRKLAARLEQLGVPFYYDEAPDGGHAGKGEGGPCGSTERAGLEFTYFHERLSD